LRLAEVISTRLADAAWEDLHRWFWTARIEAIETAEVSEIGIAFLQLKDAAGRKATSRQDVRALRYNYHSQATHELTPGPAGTPATRNLLAARKTAYPSLNQKLELHHRMMQLLHARHYLAQAKSQLQPGLDAALPARSEKVGRNDPCPCGSRKKFKKCCGG